MSTQDFEEVYRNYFSYVFYFFIKKGFSDLEAQDLTQDVFLRVFKGWDQYRHEVSAFGWLRTVAVSSWKNKIRAIKANKRDGRSVDLNEVKELAGHGKNPEEETLNQEVMNHLDREIQALPKAMRVTFILRFHQNLKYREIADLMNVSIDTVKTQLHLAKKRLKERLDSPDWLDHEEAKSNKSSGKE